MSGHSLQTNRVLIVGDSGSGKTTLARSLARQYLDLDRRELFVVVSRDAAFESALADLCGASLVLTDDMAEQGVAWGAMLDQHPRLYVEAEAVGAELFDQLDALAVALLDRGSALVIVDEANELVGNRAGRRLISLWTRGRKRWIDCIAIGQSPLQAGAVGIHREITKRSNALVSFQLRDAREAEAAARWLRVDASRVQQLRTPHDGGEPEYLVCHAPTGRSQRVGRDGVADL